MLFSGKHGPPPSFTTRLEPRAGGHALEALLRAFAFRDPKTVWSSKCSRVLNSGGLEFLSVFELYLHFTALSSPKTTLAVPTRGSMCQESQKGLVLVSSRGRGCWDPPEHPVRAKGPRTSDTPFVLYFGYGWSPITGILYMIYQDIPPKGYLALPVRVPWSRRPVDVG